MPPRRTKSTSSRTAKRQRKDGDKTDKTDTSIGTAGPASFYPPEMSNARARAYCDGTLRRPLQVVEDALTRTATAREKTTVGAAVVHWFRADLRMHDNRALKAASERARSSGAVLIGLYVVSPEDWTAHATAPVRVDFVLRSLARLQSDLATKLDVPLVVETVARRRDLPEHLADRMAAWGATHVYANLEYEVDELRRDARVVDVLAARGMATELVHDTCVVPPDQQNKLTTGAGKPYSVFTPWFKAWIRRVHEQAALLEASPPPERNPSKVRKDFQELFQSSAIPEAPADKQLETEDAERLRRLWPAGEEAASDKLQGFCTERLETYEEHRDQPAAEATSGISVHLASGTLSARSAVRTAQAHNSTTRLDGGDTGVQAWIREVAWRDFYRHILVNFPYISMNKPFKVELSHLSWADRPDHFAAWCEGRTGFPLVDAAMRQLCQTGWMHNRCRMVAASFLAKDLRLNWRRGEQFFMEHLIDGDLASNTGGWGFSASVGADPQPYFRIFSPLRQSERFDPDGTYIRAWVPELQHVSDDKAIHAPYERGAAEEARAGGYSEPVVDHSEARKDALAMYRGEDL